MKSLTQKEWIVKGATALDLSGSSTPRLDAEVLLAAVLNTQRIRLHMYPDKPVPAWEGSLYWERIQRRCQGEPVAYLTGVQEFMGLTFQVTPAVLIPRPETEHLVEAVLNHVSQQNDSWWEQPRLVVDVGTGSGCIAISLARAEPGLRVQAIDLSEDALAVARKNVRTFGLEERIEVIRGDLLKPLKEKMTVCCLPKPCVIVSNPPYISAEDMDRLPDSVADYEPRAALNGGSDGLDFYRSLSVEAAQCLEPGGLLALEIGYDQGNTVSRLLEKAGFQQVTCMADLAGKARVVTGIQP